MAKYSGYEWSISLIEDLWEDIEKIAKPYGLDYYPPQIEIISSEQMLDNYSTMALPVYYPHWSFGKRFTKDQKAYAEGDKGLAFEVVINSDPSICYIMNNNTLALQALVLAHAAVGHSTFFKNNYLFQQNTDASGIIDFMIYARNYILECEEIYGMMPVERILDACHALQYVSIDKSKMPAYKSTEFIAALEEERKLNDLKKANILWDSLFPKVKMKKNSVNYEENILKYIRNNSSVLAQWQRNIISICLYINQYFYPQMQTQVTNEGFATFWHYTLLHDMYDADLIDDGIMLEFLTNHSNVIRQSKPFIDHPYFGIHTNEYYSGINPYYLGFSIYQDIRRICENPTARDRKYFPYMAGTDWVETIKEAAYNYNDSNFIANYMSPTVMDNGKFFVIEDRASEQDYTINASTFDENYDKIKMDLARQYDLERKLPQLQVAEFENAHNASEYNNHLSLVYSDTNEKELHSEYTKRTLLYVSQLWGNTAKIFNKSFSKILFTAIR